MDPHGRSLATAADHARNDGTGSESDATATTATSAQTRPQRGLDEILNRQSSVPRDAYEDLQRQLQDALARERASSRHWVSS